MSEWTVIVESVIDKLMGDAVLQIERNAGMLKSVENYFFLALVGSKVNRYAKLERILVTMLGSRGTQFFLPFFLQVRKLPKPFDFEGLLKRNMKEYAVKVVLSDQAFNSTMQKRVAEAAGAYVNPIILTVQGDYFQPRDLGAARWLCAHDSWAFVTGERDAYQKVKDLIFAVGRRYRQRVFNIIEALDSR
ncbi:MAG: hypothetical protein QXU69_05915 [Thermofilaceae archaeon]